MGEELRKQMYNPLIENLPTELDFSLVSASFVERGGWLTITDREEQKQKRLPRWKEGPRLYFIDEEGKVWVRHFTQTRRYLKYNSVDELKEAWKKYQEEYLGRCGYTIADVQE